MKRLRTMYPVNLRLPAVSLLSFFILDLPLVTRLPTDLPACSGEGNCSDAPRATPNKNACIISSAVAIVITIIVVIVLVPLLRSETLFLLCILT